MNDLAPHLAKTPAIVAGKSDLGLVRQVNEDAFFCDWAQRGFVAIADGVGGLEYGERASAGAIEGLKILLASENVPARERPPDFSKIFRELDAKIEALGEKIVPGFGIATTLDVAVDGGNDLVHFAHLGDSGIFLFRGNALARLSVEHTLAAEEIALGNADFPENYANTLTRALGIGTNCEPQVFSLKVQRGDRVLLATDGVTRALSPAEMEAIVGAPGADPKGVVSTLLEAANATGGHDNATAVALFF